MAKKFYVVWSGRRTGVFTDWPDAHAQVDKFPGARFRSFPTRAAAEEAFSSGRAPALGSRRKTAKAAIRRKQASTTDVNAPVRIYCDGACEPNPGNAGSGIAVYRQGILEQLWYGLYHAHGTNNTAELNALNHALLMAEQVILAGGGVEVLSDSTYAINCISKWAAGWEKNDWRKAGGEIKNLDIIQAAYGVYNRVKAEARLTHVNAHVGTEGNELADRMAMLAVQDKQVQLRQFKDEFDIESILRMRSG